MSESRSILVVDDEVDILSILKDLLEFRGFFVVTASNSEEALELAKQHDFCVILADLKMPGMDGIQMAEKLRENQSASKIIIMSGYGIQVKQSLEKIGIQHYIIKPINFDHLFEKINSICENPL